jgi:hypothetical protein
MKTSMTTEQLMEWAIQSIKLMDADEKAHIRAKLDAAFGPRPRLVSRVN